MDNERFHPASTGLRIGVLPAALLLAVLTQVHANEWPGAVDQAGEHTKGAPPHVVEALLPLPDDGPRHANVGEGPAPIVFQRGIQAFQRQDYAVAAEQFNAFLKENPNSPMVPAVLAFLADAIVLGGQSSHSRSEAIAIYRVVARDEAGSANAARAEWRIGDLYFDQGWYDEAQAAYERAFTRARSSFDMDRALLGLGVTFIALGRWAEAERTFQTLRRQTTDEGVLMRATLALATTFHQQNRLPEAQLLFDECHRRWPAFIKRDPESLLRFAATLSATGQHQTARNVLAEFYNLYPRHREAPSALVRIGDLFLQSGLRRHAEMFYAWVLTAHPGTSSEQAAKMRLVELGQALSVGIGDQPLRLLVEASMQRMPGPYLDPEEQRRILREIIARPRDNVLASEAQFRLGQHFELAHEWPAAVSEYQKVVEHAGRIEHDPWPEAAAVRISAILGPWIEAALKAGDDLTAVTLFHRHGTLADRVYRGHELLRIAHAHRRLGFNAEAARLYHAIIQEPSAQPLQEEALMGLGKSYLAQEDPSAARKVFARYRFQFPLGQYSQEALFLLTRAMLRQGDRDSVIHLCREWLKRHTRHPDRPHMLALLATALADEGKADEAIPFYDEAWRAGALRSASALLRFGAVLDHDRRYDRAAAVYRQALAAEPGPDQAQWAWWQLGRIAFTQGRYREAGALLEKAGESGDPLIRRVSTALRRHLPPEPELKGG